MEIIQVKEFVNAQAKESLGIEDLVVEDASQLVDLGKRLRSSDADKNFITGLGDRIGKSIYKNKKYNGKYKFLFKDSWVMGSILLKVDADLSEAVENESWEVRNGSSPDPHGHVFQTVYQKFWNGLKTFEIDRSIGDRQYRSAFTSWEEMGAFFAMLETYVQNSIELYVESLGRALINTMTSETVYKEFPSGTGYGDKSTNRAVNLLYEFKQTPAGANSTITADTCMTDPDFIRFAVYRILRTKAYMTGYSTLFNVEDRPRFTNEANQVTVLLSDFEAAARVFLYDANGQFKDDNIKLPSANTVPFWQGSGKDFAFDSVSKINFTNSANHTVELGGILGVVFDEEAIAICNTDIRTTSDYHAKDEITDMFYKYDAQYIADTRENYVVFYVADPTT